MPYDLDTFPGLVVTGTGTSVGKTYVASGLLRSWWDQGLRIGALKPLATGCSVQSSGMISEDGRVLADALLGFHPPHECVVPLRYEAPLAPSVTARLVGTPLSMAEIQDRLLDCLRWWATQTNGILVEGVGGLMCPIADDGTFADLAFLLDYPVLLVARIGLGTLNETLQTVEAVKHRGLRLAGIVLNQATPEVDASFPFNPTELCRILDRDGPVVLSCYRSESMNCRDVLVGFDWHVLGLTPRRSLLARRI